MTACAAERVAWVPIKRTPYIRWVKPALDRALALVLLVLLSPLMATVAVVVVVSLGRPVIFRQERVGLGGRVFLLRKFRTMAPDRRARRLPIERPDRRGYHKSANDPRHTSVGRFLRRTSLDELPQLINVLLGDMSLVGPRPELTSVVGNYADWQHRRHAVRPGITGPWQVKARGDGPMHEFTFLDVAYVEEVGLANDLLLLCQTVPAALGRRSGD